MEIIPSTETLIGCKTKPPNKIHLTFKVVATLQAMQDVMNSKFIGIVLYCVYCKEPLNYTYNNGGTLFQCPKCGVKWVKSDTWIGEVKNGKRTYRNIRTRMAKE